MITHSWGEVVLRKKGLRSRLDRKVCNKNCRKNRIIKLSTYIQLKKGSKLLWLRKKEKRPIGNHWIQQTNKQNLAMLIGFLKKLKRECNSCVFLEYFLPFRSAAAWFYITTQDLLDLYVLRETTNKSNRVSSDKNQPKMAESFVRFSRLPLRKNYPDVQLQSPYRREYPPPPFPKKIVQ